jgi:hypothetical protein
LLIDFNEGLLEVTLDKVFGTSSDKLKAFSEPKEIPNGPGNEQTNPSVSAEAKAENDPMTQMAINDEFIESGFDIGEAALELNYPSSEDLLKFGTLKQASEYVKSKKA